MNAKKFCIKLAPHGRNFLQYYEQVFKTTLYGWNAECAQNTSPYWLGSEYIGMIHTWSSHRRRRQCC